MDVLGYLTALTGIYFILGLFFYFLPTIIAVARGHDAWFIVVILNLLFGWTLIVWVIVLIWAIAGGVNNPNPAVVINTNNQSSLNNYSSDSDLLNKLSPDVRKAVEDDLNQKSSMYDEETKRFLEKLSPEVRAEAEKELTKKQTVNSPDEINQENQDLAKDETHPIINSEGNNKNQNNDFHFKVVVPLSIIGVITLILVFLYN